MAETDGVVKDQKTSVRSVKRDVTPSADKPTVTAKRAPRKAAKNSTQKPSDTSKPPAPGSRRGSSRTAATKKPSPAAKTRGKTGNPATPPKPKISAADMHKMIEVAAYRRAQQRGFAGGDAHDDWLAAEADVHALLVAVDLI